MGFSSWLFGGTFRAVKITDPFFERFDIKRVALVQSVFDKLLANINVAALTRMATGVGYDDMSAEEQRTVDVDLTFVQSEMANLHWGDQEEAYLQVMLWQYCLADVYWREAQRPHWVETCLTHQGAMRPFPSGAAAYAQIKSE